MVNCRESFEKRNSFDGVSEKDAIGQAGIMNIQDYYVKDAFLIFRAFCKLSMKPLGAERYLLIYSSLTH